MDPISAIGLANSTLWLIQHLRGIVEELSRDLYISERRISSILGSLNSLRLLLETVDTICIDQDYSPEWVKQVLQMQRIYREHSPEELLANRLENLVSFQEFRKTSSKMCNHLVSMLNEKCVKDELQLQIRNVIDSSRLLVPLTSKRRRRSHLLESLIRSHLVDEKEAIVRARMMADILRNNLVSRTLLGEDRLPMADYKETSGKVLQSLVRARKDMTSVLSNAKGAKTTGCHRMSTNPVEAAVLQIPYHFILCGAGGGTVDVVTFDVKSLQPLRIEEGTEGTCGPSEASLVEKSFLAIPSGESMISPVSGNAQVGSNAEREKLHRRRSIMHTWRALAATQFLLDFAVPVEHTIHQEDESSIPTGAEQELAPDLSLDELKVLDQPLTSPLSLKGLAQLARNNVNRVRLLLLELRFHPLTRRRSRLGSVGFGRSGLQGLLFWVAPVTATSVNTETRSSKACSSFIKAVKVEMRQLLNLMKTPQPPFPRAIQAHTLLLGLLVLTTCTVLFYTMTRSKLTKNFLLVGILISLISGSLFAVDVPDFVFRYLFISTNLMLVASVLYHQFQGRDRYQRLDDFEVAVEEVKGQKGELTTD